MELDRAYAKPVPESRVLLIAWATAVLILAAGAVFHWAEGAAFDTRWIVRMAFCASVPLIMLDRLTLLSSPRAFDILGKRFRLYAFSTHFSYFACGMILLQWPASMDEIAIHITIWFITAAAFGAFMSGQYHPTDPDLADRYFDLDRLVSGNSVERTFYTWWTLFGIIAILASASIFGSSEESEFFLMFWVPLFLASMSAVPAKRPFQPDKINLTTWAGRLISIFALIWGYFVYL